MVLPSDSLIPEQIQSQRRGSSFGLSTRESIMASNKPLLQSQPSSPFPFTSRSQSLQAPPALSEQGAMVHRRTVSVKKREGKARSIISRTSSQGRYLAWSLKRDLSIDELALDEGPKTAKHVSLQVLHLRKLGGKCELGCSF